jgi:hypothetical protein
MSMATSASISSTTDRNRYLDADRTRSSTAMRGAEGLQAPRGLLKLSALGFALFCYLSCYAAFYAAFWRAQPARAPVRQTYCLSDAARGGLAASGQRRATRGVKDVSCGPATCDE